MVHSSVFYPVKNGSQYIADKFAENIDVKYNIYVESIEHINSHWIINSEYRAKNIIYTGDIRKLHSLLKVNDFGLKSKIEAVKELRSNGTSNLLCKTDATDYSWLYLPESKSPAHRIIYTGNFSKNNYPENDRRSCIVEFSGNTSLVEMKKAIKTLPGNP